jgi:sugar/nucleoside kinase (ribokinase family)
MTSPTHETQPPSSAAVLIGGSIAIDHIKTPTAQASNLLGGSASYAALAASCYTSAVHMVGIIGKDFPAEHLAMLEARGINLAGVERSSGDTFSWSGEYHENMNDRTTRQVSVNVLENWAVKVPPAVSAAPIVVLANMSPDNQLQMLEACGRASAVRSSGRPTENFVLADTMDLWISIANNRLHEVLERIDLLVINDSEAREFVGTSNLIAAGRRLLAKGPRFVVIKLGEFGAMLFSASATGPNGAISPENFFRCAAFPLGEVADPTGAGDSFLGAIAGNLAASGRSHHSFADLRSAVVQGSVVASFTCEAFSTRRLQSLTTADVQSRLSFLKSITHWP